MEEETKTIEQPHSVELSVNAKGLWSGTVKRYADTPEKAYSTALRFAEKIMEEIRRRNGL